MTAGIISPQGLLISRCNPGCIPSRRIANIIVKCRYEPASRTKRQIWCCDGTGQSAEHFYEFLQEQQANIIQVPLQAFAQVMKVESTQVTQPVYVVGNRGPGSQYQW